MHLTICTVGTLLTMAGHLQRARLWLAHVVGLSTMIAVSYDVGGGTARWFGVGALLALTFSTLRSLPAVRDRVESVTDTLAMAVLISAAPVMVSPAASNAMAGHATGGPSMPAADHFLPLTMITVAVWALARLTALRLPGARVTSSARTSHRAATLALAGPALMVTGMTLMSV